MCPTTTTLAVGQPVTRRTVSRPARREGATAAWRELRLTPRRRVEGGEVDPRVRCRCRHRSSPASPLPHPACGSHRTGRSPRLACWSAASSGGCGFRGPWGRDGVAAVAVPGHGGAGCAGEHNPVAGEPPPLVAEAAAEFSHPEPVLARILGAYPAHQPAPRMAVDRAEHCLGHSVPEVVRPPRQ